MKRTIWKAALTSFIYASVVLAARAQLVFTERDTITDLPTEPAFRGVKSFALGDPLTITYRISRPSNDPFGDPDSVVYDQVEATLVDGGDLVYQTNSAQLTVWNLVGFYGVAVSEWSAPLVDFLASSQPDVLDSGFLVSGFPISTFDSADGGSVFVDGQVIGFKTLSYTVDGHIPISAVPEPSRFGLAAGASLLVLALISRACRSLKPRMG